MIELFGLPACGKSTIAQALTVLGYKRIKITSRRELILNNLFFISRYPVLSLMGLYYFFRHSRDQRTRYSKFMNLILQHNAKYIEGVGERLSIVDQGPYQNVISLFEDKLNKKYLMRYTGFLPQPRLLVIIETPMDKRLEWAKKRGYYSRDDMGPDYIRSWQEVADHNYRLFLGQLSKMKLNYVIIQNDRPATDIAQQISNHYEALLYN